MILVLILGELVNDIIVIFGFLYKVVLIFVLLGMMCSRLVGRLVFLNMWVIMMLLLIGVWGLGLCIMVLLVVKVVVIVCIDRIMGKLNGEIILIILWVMWINFLVVLWLLIDDRVEVGFCVVVFVVVCKKFVLCLILMLVLGGIELFF